MSDQTTRTQPFQVGADHPKTTTLPPQTAADFYVVLCCKLYAGFNIESPPTSPPNVAAVESAHDFTERLAADESARSDYKSTTLLMR